MSKTEPDLTEITKAFQTAISVLYEIDVTQVQFNDESLEEELREVAVAQTDQNELIWSVCAVLIQYLIRNLRNCNDYLNIKKIAEKVSTLTTVSATPKYFSPDCSTELSEDMFKDPYQGTAAERFSKYMKAVITTKKQNLFNYTTLFQSSGHGKTRLLAEYGRAERESFVIYCCLRDPKHSGFPYTHIYHNFFVALNNKDDKFCEDAIEKFFNNLLLATGDMTVDDFWEKYSAPVFTPSKQEENFESNVLAPLLSHHTLDGTLKDAPTVGEENRYLVVCFDEARTLIHLHTKSDKSIFQIRFRV